MTKSPDIKIKHGTPAPEPKNHRLQGLTKLLKELPVGDYYIDLPTKDDRGNAYSIASTIGIRITTEAQPDGSLRVWRLD